MATSDAHDQALSAPSRAAPRGTSRRRRIVHGLSWAVAIPVALFLVLWLVLLVRPIPLPFVGGQARAIVLASMPETMDIEFGDTYLALENAFAPVLQFNPVSFTDRSTNAYIEMEALEVGFSPFRALMGQPGVIITMVAPHLQVVQDLLGPRLGRFEIAEDPDGGPATVRLLEGENSFPTIGILSQGLDVRSGLTDNVVQFRSDNDWLAYNLASSEDGMRSIIKNAEAGLFSRMIVRNATVDMHDVAYGLVRTFSDMNLDIARDPVSGDVRGKFSAVIAGQRLTGDVRRFVDDEGGIHMLSTVNDMDLSSFAPFMDDADAIWALRGTGDVVANLNFAAAGKPKLLGGSFSVNMAGTNLRIQDDYFPVTEADFDFVWNTAEARFDLTRGHFAAGQSSADMTGTFILGLDDTFGPAVNMTTTIKNLYLHPNDLDAPSQPIDELFFRGWTAPLYGAMGIDKLVARRGEMNLEVVGRADMLRSGMGFDMNVIMQDATADDLKRLWPYMMGTETRDWFVKNVTSGRVANANMVFKFPIGAMGEPGQEMRLPEGSMRLWMNAEDVEFIPVDGMDPILVAGPTRLDVDSQGTRISFGKSAIQTQGGVLNVADTSLSFADADDEASTFGLEGDVTGPISAVLAIVNQVAPDALSDGDLPLDPESLSGDLSVHVSLSTLLGNEGADNQTSYALSGQVSDFSSAEPIEGRLLTDGHLTINVDQSGYDIAGPARIDGLATDLSVRGDLEAGSEPQITIASTFTAQDLKEFGFDAGEILDGKIGFTASPLPDGGLQIEVDLADARLTVADLGLSKPQGRAGKLSAVARFDGPMIEISDIDISFGTVHLRGDLNYHQDNGLQSASFSQFAISRGDDAQLVLTPNGSGYALRVRGAQLDLKPMLKRFFSLNGGGTGGPQATAVDQSISLDVELDRALGFYSVTAFNLDTELELEGEDLRRLSLQANFGSDSSVSVTTNPAGSGRRSMSVAFNDLGTLLRFGNVYPLLVGGSGSLTMNTNTASRIDTGQFTVREFAIVNENNVAQILGNHNDSRSLIARQNRLDFDTGSASFVRQPDRIEITDAVLDGDTVGGTARGFIYTEAGQYDLAGTYVPLFGLNNAFQQIPLLGPLLGGRDGEGLIGVTFAVRGPLDNPQFLVNPASLLLPGVFRSLMEFRARERPPATSDGGR